MPKEAKVTDFIQTPPTPPDPASQINEETANAAKADSGEKPKAPATAAIPKGKQREILPAKPNEFGLATHKFRIYSAIAPRGMQPDDLYNPLFWSHVANQLTMFDEVRVLAEDGSWVAYVLVTFRHANNVKIKMLNSEVLEDVSYEVPEENQRYIAKQRGMLKWCIVDNETGENVFDRIPTQSKAYAKLESYLASLNR